MADISKITLPDNTTYNIKDNNARNFTNTPYYEQDEEALMFQLGESYMTGEQDNQPYSFRAAGGSADIGNREYDKIVGGTVVWNSVFPVKNTTYAGVGWNVIFSPDGSWTITVTDETASSTIVTNITSIRNVMVLNHKYLWVGRKYGIQIDIKSVSKYNDTIFNCTNAGFSNIAAVFTDLPMGVYVLYPMLIDLTQMFGTTIADYIYSLETATPGAGVAWFRKLFPKPYYEYNPGELMSVQAVAHKLVGFNAWDEEWELGIINTTTGEETDSNSNIRSKNYVRVIPGATYYFKLGTTDISNNIVFYDAEKNYVAASDENANSTFTVPEDAHYMKFYMSTNYGSTYLSNICINLSGNGERNGEYEEYNMHSYPLDSSLVLRGIPKLDANNQLYYDGDTYEADGTVMRKYGIVDLGTLNWTYITNGTYPYFISDRFDNALGKAGVLNTVCNKYSAIYNRTATSFRANNFNNMICLDRQSGFTRILIQDSAYTDATAFKASLSGTQLVYELATPTTETAEPYDNPQIVDSDGTEEYITTNIVFVGHETKY